MTGDPLDQLRLGDEPGRPDTRFVAGLRSRVVAALTTDLPTVSLPARSTAMTDASTNPTAASTTNPPAAGTLLPYLCVTGAADALAWYADALGAVETVRFTGDDGRVGHAEMTIGASRFMLSDEHPEIGVVSPTTLGGTPFALHLNVPDVDAVYERVVAAGATADRPPQDEAYGARSFNMLDPFGHRWMVQTPTGQVTEDELRERMPDYTITTSEQPAPPAQPGAETTAAADAGAPVEVGYASFAAPDTARAARFYGALFGWETEVGNMGDQYAHIHNTRLPMGLTPGPADEPPVLYFRVSSVDAYADRVRELGGQVIDRTTYDSGPNAVCIDDQGREFQLWEPAPGFE